MKQALETFLEASAYEAGSNDDKIHLETLSPVVMRHSPSEVRLSLKQKRRA